MMLASHERRRMEQSVRKLLEYASLEDFLEHFDMTPEETVLQLYEAGLLDPDLFEEVVADYGE